MKIIVCGECGKIRGKYAQPWKTCDTCGKIFCLCCYNRYKVIQCPTCFHKKCDKEYKEETRKFANTPVECTSCHKKKLPRYMENPYVPDICKVCANTEKQTKERQRKKNACHGLVEVSYGEHPLPNKDGGNGYAYYFNEPLCLGDIVELPQTWLGRMKGERGINLATVISTYSDYNGPTSNIIRVIQKAQKIKRIRMLQEV